MKEREVRHVLNLRGGGSRRGPYAVEMLLLAVLVASCEAYSGSRRQPEVALKG